MLNKQRGGLKALSKEKREKLEAYQHLFYLLQVRGWGGPWDFPLLTAAGAPFHAPLRWIPPQTRSASFFAADQSHLPGKADFPDASEQIHQVHGLCDLHTVQLRVQPEGGVPAAAPLPDGTAGRDQVWVD